MPYENKMESMALAIQRLEVKLGQLDWGFSEWLTGVSESLKRTKESTEKTIAELKGDLYDKALLSDAFLNDAWLPLAQSAEDALNSAIGISEKYSIREMFVQGKDNVSEALPSSTQVNVGLSFVAIAVVAVAVIFVAK